MSKKDLLILGAGGYGCSIAEVAELLGRWNKIVFVDDSWPINQNIGDYVIISDIKNLNAMQHLNYEAVVAIGNNKMRQNWQQLLTNLSIPLVTIIHPHAIVSPSAKIGRGVSIMAGCIIGTKTLIEDGVIVNIGTIIDHDAKIESFAHLSIGVKIASRNVIRPYAYLELGTIIGHTS